MVGLVGSYTILWSYMILYDPTIFTILLRFLIFLVRWDRKIVRFYDPDRDFDNHAYKCETIFLDGKELLLKIFIKVRDSSLGVVWRLIFCFNLQ